jgi:hypothetical protein
MATLFLPQLLPIPSEPHPLVLAYLQTAASFYDLRDNNKNLLKFHPIEDGTGESPSKYFVLKINSLYKRKYKKDLKTRSEILT